MARLLTGPHPTGRAAGLLVGLCLLVFLPGFLALPPVDRDEARFAQASRQMLESVALPAAQRDPVLHGGGLVLPRVQGRDRLTKPPLIYWLQAGAAAALTWGEPLRDAIWMYRVPSLLAAIAAVLATWRLGVSMFGAAAGFLAGVLLAVCPVVVWEAHQARADMVLLACTTVTMLGLWRVYQRRSRQGTLGWALVFWLALSAGAMTKGPITPMVALLTVLALCTARREWRWVLALRPVPGMLILAAAVVPWVWAVASRVGWERYWSAIYDETIGRSLATREGHWGPPGYHAVLMPVLFWPGSLLTGLSLVSAWKRRRSPECLFALAWLVPAWVVFELVTTKLPHYTLPMYPALALVSAWGVCGGVPNDRARSGPARAGALLWAIIGAVPAAALLGAIGVYTYLFTSAPVEDGGVTGGAGPHALLWVSLGVMVLAAVILYGGARAAWCGRVAAAQGRGALAAVLMFGVAMLVAAPNVAPGAATVPLAEAIRAQPGQRERAIGSAYHEDSLVFQLRGRVTRIEAPDTVRWLEDHPGGLVIAPYSQRDEFPPQRYRRLGSMPRTLIMDSVPRYVLYERTDRTP